MKVRPLLLTLFVCVLSASLYAADNPTIGVWRLNAAKSKLPPGATKNNTVMFTEDGDSTDVVTYGVDADGNTVRTEWVGKFDGKDYPVTGGASGATRSYKMVSGRKMEVIENADGKVVSQGYVEVAKDGNKSVIELESTALDGAKMKIKAVYDKH